MAESAPKLTWHPDVHVGYGELLSFAFLKVQHWSPDFFTRMQEALETAALPGYSYYDVFGSSDVILRVWSRSDSHHRLHSEINKIPGVVIQRIFTCAGSPCYLWWKDCRDSISSTDLFLYTPEELRSVQENVEPTDEDSAKRAELRLKGFFHDSRNPATRRAIKFFVRVDTTVNIEPRNLVNELDRKRAPLTVNDLSIYFSTNQALLIKGTTENYHDIGKFVLQAVRTTLPNCATETFLVAAPSQRESDVVDFAGMVLDPPLVRICAVWGIKKDRMHSLDPKTRRALSHAVTENVRTDLLRRDEERRSVLKGCFLARIYSDKTMMEEKLSFFNALEGFLFRSVVPKVMREIFGEDWQKEPLLRLSGRGRITHRYDPSQWDMGDSVNLLGVADADTSGRVAALLGDNWQPPLRSALKLRNEVNHDKIDLLAQWPVVMEQLAGILPAYYRLEDFAGLRRKS
ncbi:MAG: hypothetical protein H7144_01935 [Burkholderiales bacterium]|nr:hypothetical protein [Phycisphaerae bacterium]